MVKIRRLMLVCVFVCVIIYTYMDLIFGTSAHASPSHSSQHRTSEHSAGPALRDDESTGLYSDLEANLVPNVVHFIWCGNTTFDFVNYLSVMSAWRYQRPDTIIFHYQYLPVSDPVLYHLWFDELREMIPSFTLQQIPVWSEICPLHYGLAVLYDRGGILLDPRTVLLEKITRMIGSKTLQILNNVDFMGYVTSRRKTTDIRQLLSLLECRTCKIKTFISSCTLVQPTSLPAIGDNTRCLVLNRTIFPKDIIHDNSTISSALRKIYYGSNEIRIPVKNTSTTIPKLVHYVWIGNKTLTFAMFLSIKSVMKFINPSKILIHSNAEFIGEYWDQIKSDHRIIMVYREFPTTIYGHKILFREHHSDIARADILLKYGGIYMDWDVHWLQPVDDLLSSGYDVIADIDHLHRPPFPDSLNLGVVLAKPGAEFILRWSESMRNYKSELYTYNAVEMPYKIYERYPDLVYVEPRLQVMCYLLKCHPIWQPGYQNEAESQPFDWRTDTYSMHFTTPDPPEFSTEAALMMSNTTFAQIGRHILE